MSMMMMMMMMKLNGVSLGRYRIGPKMMDDGW
jgi:hypothetical protein